jgi:hypothetical protein
MESSDGGQGIGAFDVTCNEVSDAVAHLARGFIGESNGQNRPAGDAVGGHQMGHPVGDYSGFAASSPCQDQHGALDVLCGLPLARIEAL